MKKLHLMVRALYKTLFNGARLKGCSGQKPALTAALAGGVRGLDKPRGALPLAAAAERRGTIKWCFI